VTTLRGNDPTTVASARPEQVEVDELSETVTALLAELRAA